MSAAPPDMAQTAAEDEAVVADRTERARKIFAGPITFLKSAPTLIHLPPPSVAEIAFAGRSNV
ncbi:MAG: hypothetical protein RLZZ58_484, partial [Pseudomonadota bacterium]